jgi:hypothetical protein
MSEALTSPFPFTSSFVSHFCGFTEYETVHGRILAVNMAHWEKRKRLIRDQETKRSQNENVFESIEKDNEGK